MPGSRSRKQRNAVQPRVGAGKESALVRGASSHHLVGCIWVGLARGCSEAFVWNSCTSILAWPCLCKPSPVVWLPRNKTEIRDEKLSHYKCSKCHKMGQLAMSCPNKKEKKQHDSSEDDSKISQVQVNVNFEVGDKLGRKKTRRGGRRGN